MDGLAYTGGVNTPAAAPVAFLLGPDARLHIRPPLDEIAAAYRTGAARLWVDIDSRNDAEWAVLSDLFGFHPLAVEDTRSPDCRVKLEEYDGYVFLVVRGIHLVKETPEPYDIDTHNLYLFIGAHFVVSVHAGAFASVDAVVERLEAGAETLARGVDHLAYVLVDTLVDEYFPLLDTIDGFLEELEYEIFDGDHEQIGRIFELKRTLVGLRRHLAPMRETMASVANRPTPFLRTETQIYFRDVHDHVIRQLEAVEAYRELLTSSLETQLAIASNRMNEIIKALSVIATVVLPPTLVASIYGMNFDWLPFLHHPAGFWIALGAMLGITGALVIILRRKGWL